MLNVLSEESVQEYHKTYYLKAINAILFKAYLLKRNRTSVIIDSGNHGTSLLPTKKGC